MRNLLIFSIALSCWSCQQSSDPLEQLLNNAKDPVIRQVMSEPDKFEVQIIYTQIDSTATGIEFTDYSYSWENGMYFYPASTVKLPMALAANELLAKKNIPLDTPYLIEGDSMKHNVANDIRRILAVSDNAAYNRLYELVGRDRVNKDFYKRDVKIWLAHRLSVADAAEAARKRLGFLLEEDTLWLGGGTDRQQLPNFGLGTVKGRGYISGDSLVDRPMDFSLKNSYPLKSQHQLLKQLFFPQQFDAEKSIVADLNYLKECMHLPPRMQGYDEVEYYDGYVKFLLYGDTKNRIPGHIRQYNKVGYAYGTLTDASYVVDGKNGLHFILSATILVNEDGIFNDDKYEYDTIGIPFLAALGREIYQLELARKAP